MKEPSQEKTELRCREILEIIKEICNGNDSFGMLNSYTVQFERDFGGNSLTVSIRKWDKDAKLPPCKTGFHAGVPGSSFEILIKTLHSAFQKAKTEVL